MDASSASSLLVAIALIAANLPFFNEHAFGLIALPRARQGRAAVKPFWLRLAELVVLYFAVGALATLLESRIGNVFAQAKEFYMITVPLFAVLAFPGFVWRYLRLRRR